MEAADSIQKSTYDWLQQTLINLSTNDVVTSPSDDPTEPDSLHNSFLCEPNNVTTDDVLVHEPEPLEPLGSISEDDFIVDEMIHQRTTRRLVRPEDQVKLALTRLYGIFARGKTSLAIQRSILEFMRELTPEIIEALPIDGRTLRPPRIPFIRRELPPGELIYFGIEAILALPGIELFDKESNEVNLSLGIDLSLIHI